MKILYLSQYFPPEVGATQTRAYEMARGLVRAGHKVTVIGEIPNHPSGIVPPEYRGKLYERSELDGIDVLRVWVWASPVKTFRTRLAFYFSYMFSSFFAGLFLVGRGYDVIYATSPPLFVGASALLLGFLRRTPLFFEVRDLWPESAVRLGELRSRSAIALSSWLERLCYWWARRVVVVTRGIYDRLVERGYSDEKLVLITNGANTDIFGPRPGQRSVLREKLGFSDEFMVLYAGVHGLAQGLETVIEAARSLEGKERIRFVFLGEGPEKPRLTELANKLDLTNVLFLGEVRREDMPSYYAAADATIVPLKKLDIFKGALPSKMFDSWACECPVLLAVDGEARRVLEACGGGVFVEPENAVSLFEGIMCLNQMQDRGKSLGRAGREFTLKHYSRRVLAEKLEHLLRETAD